MWLTALSLVIYILIVICCLGRPRPVSGYVPTSPYSYNSRDASRQISQPCSTTSTPRPLVCSVQPSTLAKEHHNLLISTSTPVTSYLHRCHAQYLAPLLRPQLLSHDAVDATSDRVAGLVDEHARVVVEPDRAAVAPADPVPRPYHDCVSDITSLDLGAAGGCHACGVGASLLLYYDDDSIT